MAIYFLIALLIILLLYIEIINRRGISGFWISDDEIFLYIDDTMKAGYIISEKTNSLAKISVGISFNPFAETMKFSLHVNDEIYNAKLNRTKQTLELFKGDKLYTKLYKETKV